MIRKISKIKNLKLFLVIVIVMAIMQNFELPKNIFKIFKNDYDLRLINSYKHYCHNESIGFLSHIKKKYKIKNSIKIKNYFISPDPSWFFLQNNNAKKIKDKMILLGYSQYETIKFIKKKNYFISINDIKKLENIKKIIFYSKDEINANLVKLEIYEESFGTRTKIHSINLKSVKQGKNILQLDNNFSTYLGNSKIIVKFISNFKDKNLNFQSLEFHRSNEIDLSKHIIFEKYNSCYLISKHD
tara:strand:- start:4067 stop:4795 length:729 start_codon:yes stop_codon:yes gene_type:complete